MPHVTPGYNGWTQDSPKTLRAIHIKTQIAAQVAESAQTAERRERAELEYYEENNCFPRPTGYFGTETDAHFYER